MKRIISLILALVVCLSIVPIAQAISGTKVKPQNTVGIKVFNQKSYSSSKWNLYGKDENGRQRTLASSGCGIFAHAHAIQWVTSQTLSSDILTNLISLCDRPFSGVHKKCVGNHSEQHAYKVYGPYIQKKYPVRFEFLGNTKKSASMKKAFESQYRGAIIVTIGGHIHVGVEQREGSDGIQYVHIIDSAVGNSIGKVSSSGRQIKQPYYVKNGNEFYKVDIVDSANMGGDYWITAADFDDFYFQSLFVSTIPQYTTVDSIPRIAKSVKDGSSSDPCYLKKGPYEAADTHRIAEKGELIYLSGSVENQYGNLWYKTESGHFIWKNDIEILDSDIRNKSTTAFSAVGVAKTTDCYLKDKAYEVSAHSKTVAKGKSVEIVETVVNRHGNTWYKTSDGKYVYSGDVTVYECKELFELSAAFTNTERRNSRIAPYADSPAVKKYNKDATVTAKRFVVNSYGNIWAEIADGSYLCFYDYDTKENKLDYQGTYAAVTVTGDNAPPANLAVGKAFGLKGVLTSKIPYYRVSAHVVNSETREHEIKVSVSPSLTVRKIELNKKIAGTDIKSIDNKVEFNKLPEGYYQYAITAQMGFKYKGVSFYFGTDTILLKSDFTVGNPQKDAVLQDKPNYTIEDALRILQYDAGWNVSINLKEMDANGDGKVNHADATYIINLLKE